MPQSISILVHSRSRQNRSHKPVGIFVLSLCLLSLKGAAQEDASAGPGPLVVGQNADGRLEIFRINAVGELRHRWQKDAVGDWSQWSLLGGTFFRGIAVVNDANGALEVFAVDRATQELKHIRQTAPNSPAWSDWEDLGGSCRAPVSVGRNIDGRLEVFAVRADTNTVAHIWQNHPGGAWSEWTDLGGAVHPGLSVGRNKDGRLEVFGVSFASNTLVHCWQKVDRFPYLNASTNWSGWDPLGGFILPQVAVANNVDGRQAIFGVNRTNGMVNSICQIFSGGNIHWSQWCELDGEVGPELTPAQNADGRLIVFALSRADSKLMECGQRVAGETNFSSWAELSGPMSSAPAVIRNRDGTLQIFALPKDDESAILFRRQVTPNGEWSEWCSLERTVMQFRSRTWTTEDGLPHNQVQAIAQTRDGYLWLGTREGLARFDGMQFTIFGPGNTPEMKNSYVSALSVDREGSLWIGTYGGLLRLKDGEFSNFGVGEGLPSERVTALRAAKDGAVWIGTTNGVCRYHEGKFTRYSRAEGLTSDLVTAIGEDREGAIWVGTGDGLNRFWQGRMTNLTKANGLSNHTVLSVCQDREGRLWLGSNHGLFACENQQLLAYKTRHGLSDNFVSAVYQDREGELWVGTFSGLNRFRDGRFLSELNNDGLNFDKVLAIFEDRESNLWIGSRDGLTRLIPRRFTAINKRNGLAHNNVMSVREDRNGTMWIGTWGGGLNQMKDGLVRAYTTTNGFPHDLILSTCEGSDGSLWAGADFDGGLVRMLNGEITHYDKRNGLLNAGIRVIHEDKAGNLWLGTSHGLSLFKDGKFTNYTRKDQLPGEAVRVICEDRRGTVWFGTDGGLSRWDRGHFTNFRTNSGLSDNSVLAMYEDREGNFWIGTGNGGLNRMRAGKVSSTGAPLQFTAYTTKQGLFSDEILSILEDDRGWLWMSCSRGIFRVQKRDLDELDQGKIKSLTSIAYGKADGLESTLCNGVAQPAAWKSHDGRLWFPTTKGLISVVPDMPVSRVWLPIFIEQVLADKRAMLHGQPVILPPVGNDEELSGGSLGNLKIQVPPGRGELEFRFTALNFRNPEKSLFRYRLDGVDTDWIDAGSRRVAHYNNIYPGIYRFRVMACNSDGVWNESSAALAISLTPHVWQTVWFRILAGIGIVASLAGVVLIATRWRLQRKLELLQQQAAVEKERGRIAKDIHDDLGASLTRIMMLGERVAEDINKPEVLAGHVDKIVTSARATVQAMDEVVWAVNPENDSLDGLIGYINQYATQLFENTKVRCRLEMPQISPQLMLPAEVRHDLFLAVKEALHNVLKHAGASEVHLKVWEAEGRVEITIEDDGCGFDAAARNGNGNGGRSGHGLANMRKRMEEIGGEMKVLAEKGKGTEIRFSVTVKSPRVEM
jgi:ligand-binding sensor domain-containing protein/signal transduction histidine kinase